MREVLKVSTLVACWLCLLVTTACFENPAVTCKDGRICAPGNFCDEAHGGCSTSSQIVACNGKDQEAPCTYPGVPDGACYEGVCLPAGCGNGIVAATEACDDGNRQYGDGCSADCMSNETCGNGVTDLYAATPEQCDDGNTVDGDNCHANCKLPVCGDGITDTQFNEACDDGANNSDSVKDACRTNCQKHFCGDQIVDSDEICDDGNTDPGDGCFYNCKSAETCGNGYIDFTRGEQCEDANALSHDGCSDCRVESPTWRQAYLGSPYLRYGHAMAYDSSHNAVVLFGGRGITYSDDTWEWTAGGWTQANTSAAAPRPTGRADHGMAYDAANGMIVLFGGHNSATSYFSDTWLWDGLAWTNVTGSTAPPGRSGLALAYDSARKRVVMFGGIGSTGRRNDTWEWDGTAWSQITPTGGSPPGRYGHSMVYDPVHGKTIMFGGSGPNGALDDTWAWDGSTWANLTTSSKPPGRYGHAMAYDGRRRRVVLFGGVNGAADTWEWDGSGWTNVALGSTVPGRDGHAMAYDIAQTRVVLFGGSGFGGALSDTWQWDGLQWTEVTPSSSRRPGNRTDLAAVYDAARANVIAFGGYDTTQLGDTWSWNGHAWTNIVPPGLTPAARNEHALVYDDARAMVVMFGGLPTNTSSTLFDDTWEWNGSQWTQITPATQRPPARFGHAMAYDRARAKTVLFGGFPNLNDTWEWNGTTWTEVTPSQRPSPRDSHAMAYDAVRGKVVLFGGYSGTFLGDTWEWDGINWKDVTPAAPGPATRIDHAMTFDLSRGRVLLFGGSHEGVRLDDVWEWDGQHWTDVTPSRTTTGPGANLQSAVAFDAARRESVLVGGISAAGYITGTWLYRFDNGGQEEACRFEMDGDRDTLTGCADPDCSAYCTPGCNSTLQSCAGAMPRCGDGTCNSSIESGYLCPADCGPPPPLCGDFVCTLGESASGCAGDCTGVPMPPCHDGKFELGEECDDNNTVDTDACRNNCVSARCGDGVVYAGVEDCDDGNFVDNDGCSNACKLSTAIAANAITTFSAPSLTFTKVAYSSEAYDAGSEFDTATNRFTAKLAGDYLVCGSLFSNGTSFELEIYKNGTREKSIGYGTTVARGCRTLRLAAGDYLEIWMYQNSGSTVSVSTNTYWDSLSIQRVNAEVQAVTSTTFNLPNSSFTRVPYDSETYDDAGNYTPASARYTATQAHDALVCSSMITTGLNWAEMDIYKNGARENAYGYGGGTAGGCRTIRLAANDYIETWMNQATGGTLSIPSNAFWNWTTMTQQTASVSLDSCNSFSLSNTTFTKVPYVTEDYDANNEFDTTTSSFTAATAGDYLICASFDTRTVNVESELDLFKNGTRLTGLSHTISGASTGCHVMRLAANDTIDVRAYQSSGSTIAITSDGIWYWLQVSKLR